MQTNMELLTDNQRQKTAEWFDYDNRLHHEHPMFINAYNVLIEFNKRKDSDFDPDKIFFVIEEECFSISHYTIRSENLNFKTLDTVAIEINNQDNLLEFYSIIDDKYTDSEYEITQENIEKIVQEFVNAYKNIIQKSK